MSLTIAYITSRRDCRIEWFADSLANECAERGRPESIIVVDHFFAERQKHWLEDKFVESRWGGEDIKHITPKPNVWNGQHRLTSVDWFAMASARNTTICLCKTTHIAFVDDLSVLLPGWLAAVYEAVEGNYIGCGVYRKVRKLVVENGSVVSFDDNPSGMDYRIKSVTQDVQPCPPGWLYGCSVVAPLEDLLEVGGWPEFCDGLGSEDYCLGIALGNAGKQIRLCRKMMTLEAEELHFVEPAMKRTDKGVSPNDKSHAALKIAQGSVYYPNYYDGGMRALRKHVLAGNPFPIVQIPDKDWYDGQLISEM